MKKILIMTALQLEFEAVKKYLTNLKTEAQPETKSIYTIGDYIFGTSTYEILLVETGAGNNRSTDETGRAIQYFKPDYTFFVGIAGGIKDVRIGSVVASSKVIGYEMGKSDAEFKPRFDSMPASYQLEQLAKHVSREKKWFTSLNREVSPNSIVGPIAAGEKVVSSTRSVVYDYTKKYCSEAIAVDMEGIGFLIAARPYTAHAIEIRGISDLLENKELSDAQGSQPLAAENASAFTFEMINELDLFSKKSTEKLNDLDFKAKLVNTLSELYDQGPETNQIWKRAGGDVSILVNSSSRKSQWYDAIDKLLKGGGGKNITLDSLLTEAIAEYPNNELIAKLGIKETR